ncbi:RNA polymerase sigma factor [Streptomyces durocortorensis]|uniref:Sigma-70 family RNA polymerase sigma factor n=1 Tax=Streptomyces durocortorensis TaxID=2811104 RepID=A0ABS2I4J8_9ACTN|nr:sigma-70 family RNA polymerase sigma factor [Streptomyces durocortorensis]MBM7057887.1 sigma-70 family RNA polymerase sigma factor [Streptomyces durocortorensis]
MASDNIGPAFDQLYRTLYRRMLAKGIVVCGGNSVVAQDAVQEAFIRCWRRMKDVHSPPVENWPAWLSTVVVRECLAALRHLPNTLPLEGCDFSSTTPDLAAHLDLKDAYRRVCAAIAQLSEQQRAAVALCCMADLDANRAGAIMGIEAATVRVHLSRARRTLGPLWGEFDSLGVFDDQREGGTR